MNIEEKALVVEAIRLLGTPTPTALREAAELLRRSVKVRKALSVCERCLKIGGCEHVKA